MRYPRAIVFFTLYVCAVVYLSLFPGQFVQYPKANGLFWVGVAGRRQVMDAVLNIFFYVPVGAAGFLAIRRGWMGWLLAILTGTGLSWVLEYVQLWSPSRFGNLTDLGANVAGTCIGATAAYAVVRWNRFPFGLSQAAAISRWRLPATGALFQTVWILWQMFPLIPSISAVRLTEATRFIAAWSWGTFIETMLGFGLLRLVVGASPWLWVAYAALVSQAFLVDRSLSFSALSGAALGWVGAASAGGGGARAAGLILPGYLLLEELRPFSFGPQTQGFGWAPFETWFQSGGGFYPILFRKLFFYAGVVWSLRQRQQAWGWAVGIPLMLLAGGEWAQQYLVGRTPESTDVVILVVAATLLALCTPRARLKLDRAPSAAQGAPGRG